MSSAADSREAVHPKNGCGHQALGTSATLLFILFASILVGFVDRIQSDNPAITIGGLAFFYFACVVGMIVASIATAAAAWSRPWIWLPILLLEIAVCVGAVLSFTWWIS